MTVAATCMLEVVHHCAIDGSWLHASSVLHKPCLDGCRAAIICVSIVKMLVELGRQSGTNMCAMFGWPISMALDQLQEAAAKQEEHSSHAALDSVSTQLFGMPNGEAAAHDNGPAPMAVEEQELVRITHMLAVMCWRAPLSLAKRQSVMASRTYTNSGNWR